MKEDYLRECISDINNALKKSVPLDQFSAEFCVYCINNKCARSGANNTLFQKRVNGWYENLFLNVPRVDGSDPKHLEIQSRWFKKPDPIITKIEVETPVITEITKEIVSEDTETQEKTKAIKPKKKPAKKKTKAKSPEKTDIVESPSESIFISSSEPEKTQGEPTQPKTEIMHEDKSSVPPINTSWDKPLFIDGGTTDIVIGPGGSFTFGSK